MLSSLLLRRAGRMPLKALKKVKRTTTTIISQYCPPFSGKMWTLCSREMMVSSTPFGGYMYPFVNHHYKIKNSKLFEKGFFSIFPSQIDGQQFAFLRSLLMFLLLGIHLNAPDQPITRSSLFTEELSLPDDQWIKYNWSSTPGCNSTP